MFGFTLEPRPSRARYQPPKSFLHHIEFSDSKRHQEYLETHPAALSAGNEQCKHRNVDKSLNAKKAVKQSTKKGSHSLSNNTHPPGYNCGTSSSGKHRSYLTDNSDSRGNNGDFPSSPLTSSNRLYGPMDDTNIFWESSLLLPAMPDEVRKEVGLLLADLIVRLKQLLFNSILCAYYVGFIPVQFADVSICGRRHVWGG